MLGAPEGRAEGRWQVCGGTWCIFTEGKKILFDRKEVSKGDAGKAALHEYLAHNGSFIRECLKAIQKYPYFMEEEINIL